RRSSASQSPASRAPDSRDGKRIKSFRGAWDRATNAAGLAGRIPHDFRRTAVRNLERAGVPRSVAMKLVGHKTDSSVIPPNVRIAGRWMCLFRAVDSPGETVAFYVFGEARSRAPASMVRTMVRTLQ